jgi:hypothetical protein
MNSIVKDLVRHIQIKNTTIAYSPNLYRVIIQRPVIHQNHPTQYDESDDIEYQKHYDCSRPHRLSKIRWGEATIDNAIEE